MNLVVGRPKWISLILSLLSSEALDRSESES